MTRSERIKKAGDGLVAWAKAAADTALVITPTGRIQTWREATAPSPIEPGSRFFKCVCFGEAVEVVSSDEDYGINLAFWQMGQDGRGVTFKDRIRRAWRILRGRNPYSDMVILHPATARKLADTLVGMADHIEATATDEHKTPEPE